MDPFGDGVEAGVEVSVPVSCGDDMVGEGVVEGVDWGGDVDEVLSVFVIEDEVDEPVDVVDCDEEVSVFEVVEDEEVVDIDEVVVVVDVVCVESEGEAGESVLGEVFPVFPAPWFPVFSPLPGGSIGRARRWTSVGVRWDTAATE